VFKLTPSVESRFSPRLPRGGHRRSEGAQGAGALGNREILLIFEEEDLSFDTPAPISSVGRPPAGAAGSFAVVILLAILSALPARSQTGTIHGTIHDAKSGEELVSANITVVGTPWGTVSDLNGTYTLRRIPASTCNVRVSLVGYVSRLIRDVTVKEGEAYRLDVDLDQAVMNAEEVVVTAERQTSTESALLSARRKAASISDGVSVEQIRRTPDATSGDALKRVVGVSIVDNKFAFVRGMTDRYSATTLDGIQVTSTDNDIQRKSFAFDMIPANMLANAVVTKAATPDLPGDFSGGLVQLSTVEFPTQRVLKASLSGSYNNMTTTRSIKRAQGGTRDWLGMDDGSRSFPQAYSTWNPRGTYELGTLLPNSWAPKTIAAAPNGGLSLTIGDQIPGEDSQIGYIAALSYRTALQRTEFSQNFSYPDYSALSSSSVKDEFSVLWGAIVNVSWKFGGLHKISFKNNYDRNAADQATDLTIIDPNDTYKHTVESLWKQRGMYLGQLDGEHNFPALGGATLDWQFSYSTSHAEEPDRRVIVYQKAATQPDSDLTLSLGHRYWSDAKEYTRTASGALTFPLAGVRLKCGVSGLWRQLYYGMRFYTVELDRYRPGDPVLPDYALAFLPIDRIFAPENFGPHKMTMSPLYDAHDSYTGSQSLYAGYAMVDLPFGLFGVDFRFVGGWRLENSEQLLHTFDQPDGGAPFVARVANVDVLPSDNLTWIASPEVNLRLAFNESVNRPEFRELSTTSFYDYTLFENNFGNPNLVRSLTWNYDVRLEYFPRPGEVVALSAFNKVITHPIEQRILSGSNPTRTWFNSDHGNNYGWELELRKSLGFLGAYLGNFSLLGNYARVFSAIDNPLASGVVEKREMQGQSPYTLNLGMLFNEPSLGTSVALLYYEFGDKMDAVGDERWTDIIEVAHGTLDLSVTQALPFNTELKFTVRDLGAGYHRFETRGGPGHPSVPYKLSFGGSTFGLQLSTTL